MITVALLHKFVYEFRGNKTYIILDRTALNMGTIYKIFGKMIADCSQLIFFTNFRMRRKRRRRMIRMRKLL